MSFSLFSTDLGDRMALSFFKAIAPKAARSSRKPLSLRNYSTGHHGHAEVGPVEKRVLKTRVVFPSPLGRSNVHPSSGPVLTPAEIENQVLLSPEKTQGTVSNVRSVRISVPVSPLSPTNLNLCGKFRSIRGNG